MRFGGVADALSRSLDLFQLVGLIALMLQSRTASIVMHEERGDAYTRIQEGRKREHFVSGSSKHSQAIHMGISGSIRHTGGCRGDSRITLRKTQQNEYAGKQKDNITVRTVAVLERTTSSCNVKSKTSKDSCHGASSSWSGSIFLDV